MRWQTYISSTLPVLRWHFKNTWLFLSALNSRRTKQYQKRKICRDTRKYKGTVNRTEFVEDIKQKRLGWEKSQSILSILWFYSGKVKVVPESKGLGFSSRVSETANSGPQGLEAKAANRGRQMKELGCLPGSTVWLAVHLQFHTTPVKPR